MRVYYRVVTTAVVVICVLGLSMPMRAKTSEPRFAAKKVVLTWNAPVDLDLHLIGPLGREKTFHVSPSNRSAGSRAELRDEAASGGLSQSINIAYESAGVYQFYVYNFSDKDLTSGSSLSNSGATVSVYFGNTLKRIFSVPTGTQANLWAVFSMTGDALTEIGNMTIEQDPDKIGWNLESALIPGDILLGTIPDSLVPGKWSHVAIYAGDGTIIEAPSENETVVERTTADWEYPNMTWVTYLRVITADSAVRRRAVEFALEQERKRCPYDIRFYTKQRNGGSWYCSELIWAAYLNASNDRIDLGGAPDWLGVYPWQIDHNNNVAVIGGHYEEKPARSWRVITLAIKTVYDHLSSWVGESWHKMFK